MLVFLTWVPMLNGAWGLVIPFHLVELMGGMHVDLVTGDGATGRAGFDEDENEAEGVRFLVPLLFLLVSPCCGAMIFSVACQLYIV